MKLYVLMVLVGMIAALSHRHDIRKFVAPAAPRFARRAGNSA